jgi:hypothetical protein
MNASQIYLVVTGICLVIGVIVLYVVRRLCFFLVGVLFGQNQVSGYTFISLGVILAVVDLIRKTKPD